MDLSKDENGSKLRVMVRTDQMVLQRTWKYGKNGSTKMKNRIRFYEKP